MHIKVLGALLAIFLASGCAATSTQFKETWKRPGYAGKVRKVYIIGVTRNDKLRQTFEEELARQLAARGVTGVPSYTEMKNSGQIDREALRARLQAKGTDAVLVARLAGNEQRSAMYSAREAGYGIGTGPFNIFYEEYYNGSVEVMAPGPAATSDYNVVNISANLFETKSAQAVWSTLTETTVSFDNREQRLREFVQSMASKMQEEGLF